MIGKTIAKQISKLYKSILSAWKSSTKKVVDLSGKGQTLESSTVSSSTLLEQGVVHCLLNYEGEPVDQFIYFIDIREEDIMDDLDQSYVDCSLKGHYVDFVEENFHHFEGMWISVDDENLKFDLTDIGMSKCYLGYILSPELDALEVGQSIDLKSKSKKFNNSKFHISYARMIPKTYDDDGNLIICYVFIKEFVFTINNISENGKVTAIVNDVSTLEVETSVGEELGAIDVAIDHIVDEIVHGPDLNGQDLSRCIEDRGDMEI